MEKFYNRIPVPLIDPGKPITEDGKPVGLTALDYWRFQFSNIWDAQEEVAEFLVAKSLGLEQPCNKNGWTPFDILYKEKRVEIKATSYFHSWRGDGKVSSRRSFSIAKAYGQHDESTEFPERKNDVYVFCLNLGDSFDNSDPFELSHWEFYVIPTVTIDRECGDNATISLERIKSLTNLEHGVSYRDLKSAIDAALVLK